MLKKISNVYEYIDYKIILNDDFLERTSSNHSYSMRAYSRDLKLSPSFLSELLRGQKELSTKKGRVVFEKLGFNLEELDYIESLIKLKTSKNPISSHISQDVIAKFYKKPEFVNDPTKDLILKSADHFIIHGIVGGFSKITKILEISYQLGIEKERALIVINDFVQSGYIKKIKNEYFIINLNVKVPHGALLLSFQKLFTIRLIELTEKSGGMKVPEKMGHSLVMGFDEDTFQVAVAAYRHLINTLCRLSNKTAKAKYFTFFSSYLYSIES